MNMNIQLYLPPYSKLFVHLNNNEACSKLAQAKGHKVVVKVTLYTITATIALSSLLSNTISVTR